MTPQQLGLPAKFKQFNHYQFDAIQHTVEAFGQGTRFVSHCIPVGGGKTGVGVGVGMWLKLATLINRFAYVTPGKALQDQVVNDFGSVHVTDTRIVDMRGRDNYKCSKEDKSHAAYQRTCKQMEKRCHYTAATELPIRNKCPYRYAQFVAATSPQFSTNYAYWLSRGYDSIAGPDNPVGLLVCDEAHHIEDTLTNALTGELFGAYQEDARILDLDAGYVRTLSDKKPDELGKLAGKALQHVKARLEDGGYYDDDDRQYIQDTELLDRLFKVSRASDGNFVIDKDKEGTFLFQPVWVGKYAESMWRNVPYVLLMSGTINHFTHKYLGLKKDSVDHTDWPYVFDASRSPIYWVKTASMTDRDVKHNPSNVNVWLSRFSQIAGSRMEAGRSGIFHTVSFERAKLVVKEYTRKYGNKLITNLEQTTAKMIKEYTDRAAKGEGVCMISPSITTGLDLPNDLCRFNIVGKVPFEASKTPLMQARRDQDRMYNSVRASNTFHQMIGRSTRNAQDWCENFVIDDSIGWFTKQGLMQKWCYVRPVPGVPKLLEVD